MKTAAVTTAGVSASLMASGNYAYAGGTDTIRVGLVGCGGRGTGAASNAVEADDAVEIVAMGDLFEDRLKESVDNLQESIGDKLVADESHRFVGWDAYEKVLQSDIDYVILATPPAFRPMMFEAAVEAGVHVFMEKPVATDTVGIRRVMAAAERAEEKNLTVVAGTQRRHDQGYRTTMHRIHDGAIGEVVAGSVYWNMGELWLRERKPGMSDMEWQVRNWLYFTWASGDHIVEQHVHNIDVANWAIQSHPVKAVGVGGRQVRTSPEYGHIFDHFAIEFEYPNGARVLSMARQQDGTARHVGEHLIGTKGTSDGHSIIEGENSWEFTEEKTNPYVQEHANLMASMRADEGLNEGKQVAESVLSAIMGREAAYTGQEITWEEISNADLELVPQEFSFRSLPMQEVAVPGRTGLNRAPFREATTAASQ
jgi:predicted dehydrogenase